MSKTADSVNISGTSLTIEEVVRVARGGAPCVLTEEATTNINASHKSLETLIQGGGGGYGISTGFGSLSNCNLAPEQMAALSRNLITSHSVAVGDPLPSEVVRAAMLVRANTLARGNSGVKPDTVRVLIAMLNRGVTPIVRSQGSLASSGDLCLLSHVALVYTEPVDKHDTNDGRAVFNGKEMSGKEAMAAAGIERIRLGPKEGLAVTNGASFTAAWGCLLVWDARRLRVQADEALSLSLEAMCGCSAAFDPRPHEARNESGQSEVAAHIRELTRGSGWMDSQSRKQDAYSLRCAPQVHGAVETNINHVCSVLAREINASTDNPLLFGTDVISAGNFHGEGIGFVLDLLKLLVAELGAISERRTARLVDPSCSNGLPAMLIDSKAQAGLHSGFMIAQYTSAALVLDSQGLCAPSTTLSLPTSANQEDHNSNAWNAARAVAKIVDNTRRILSIEFLCAWRGVTQRGDHSKLGVGTRTLYDKIARVVTYQAVDYSMQADMLTLESMLFQDVPSSMTTVVVENDVKHKEMRIGLPSGMRDLHPHQMRIRERVLATIVRAFKLAGAVSIETPVVEKRETLFGKYGDESKKLVFDLEDQGGQLLTLRFDLTVPLARYVAMNNLSKLKRYQFGPVFRRDSPSMEKGRYRQFYQFDFDNVGGNHALMVPDAETISIMNTVFEDLKIGEFVIKINHRRLLTLLLSACGVPEAKHDTACSSIDKLDKTPWRDIMQELLRKGLLPASVESIGQLMTIEGAAWPTLARVQELLKRKEADAPKDMIATTTTTFKEAGKVLDEMRVLFEYLDAYGCLNHVEFCLNLARGLSYYTGMIYEVVMRDRSLGMPSLGGGGRYDNLVGMFHPQGRQLPAVGGSVGIERVFAVMESRAADAAQVKSSSSSAYRSAEIQVFVTSIRDEKQALTGELIRLVRELRQAGLRAEMSYDAVPQMKESLAHVLDCEIPVLVILGLTEFQSGTVSIKNTQTRAQQSVPRADMVTAIRSILAA